MIVILAAVISLRNYLLLFTLHWIRPAILGSSILLLDLMSIITLVIVRLLVRRGIVDLRLLHNAWISNLGLTWHSFGVVLIFGVHVVIILLLQRGPTFIVFVLRIIFKEGLGCRWLRLIVADVSADVFALIELHVLLLSWRPHYYTLLIGIIQDIRICYVLSVNASTALNQWKLLGIQILIRVWSESARRFLLIVTSICQIGQFLLVFAKFVIVFLLVRINAFDLIGASYLYFCSVAAHVIWMFAILRKWIRKGCSHAWLSQWASVLLLQHVFLLSEFFKPLMLQCLTCCNSIIRIIHQQFLN